MLVQEMSDRKKRQIEQKRNKKKKGVLVIKREFIHR